MHIAKTGGSFINKIFETEVGSSEYIEHLEASSNMKRFDNQSYVSGHLYLNAWKSLRAEGYEIVTIFRDPFEQLRSHIEWIDHYNLSAYSGELSALDNETKELVYIVKNLDLTNYQEMDHFMTNLPDRGIQYFDNCQARYLLFDGKDVKRNTPITLRSQGNLVRRLSELKVFGITEDMKGFLQNISDEFSINFDHVKPKEKVNTAKSIRKIPIHNSQMRFVLTKRLYLDIFLLNKVKKLLS